MKKQKPLRPRWRVPDAAVFAVLAAVVLIFFIRMCGRPPLLTGDGAEYLCTARNWYEAQRPWFTRAELERCAAGIGRGMPLGGFVARRENDYDALHFWLLSLLACPFVVGAKLFRQPSVMAFPVLHLCLFIAAARRLLHAWGTARTTAVCMLMAGTPLLYFIDKAHSEFFVCCGLLLAFSAVWEGKLLEGAFWTAVVSNQQMTLAPFAGALAAVWLVLEGKRGIRFQQFPRAVVWLLPVLLAPAYYLVRYRTPSLIGSSGAVNVNLVSAHRGFSLLVDPDIGLFPHWPVGLALIAAAAAIAATPAVRPRGRSVALLFTACYFALLPLLISVQSNWNSGGTVYISRYALYFIPPVVLAFVVMAYDCAERLGPGNRRALVRAGVTLALAAVTWIPLRGNLVRFAPVQGENYLQHSDAAVWLYDKKPQWYDPEPEVFLERSVGTEFPASFYRKGTWAVSNFTCTKLLLVRPAAELLRLGTLEKPIGCVSPLDVERVAAAIARGEHKVSRRGYVDLPE